MNFLFSSEIICFTHIVVNIPVMGKPGNAFRASQNVSSPVMARLQAVSRHERAAGSQKIRSHLDFKEALMHLATVLMIQAVKSGGCCINIRCSPDVPLKMVE
jgi:hypothetical protein